MTSIIDDKEPFHELPQLIGATIKEATFTNIDWPEMTLVFEDGRTLVIEECGQAGWIDAKLITPEVTP